MHVDRKKTIQLVIKFEIKYLKKEQPIDDIIERHFPLSQSLLFSHDHRIFTKTSLELTLWLSRLLNLAQT